MSEKTKEVPQLADATYAHTLVIKSTHEYKVDGPNHKTELHWSKKVTPQFFKIQVEQVRSFFFEGVYIVSWKFLTSLVFSDITS